MGENAFRTRGYLRIFASYYKPHWKLFALDMVCALCICLVDLTFPVASRYSMQNLLPGRQFGAFFAVMALLALAYVLKGVFYYIITYWGHLLGVRMEADIRRDLFTHMQKLSFSFYDKNRTGQLMSRVTGDLFEITELAHHGPEDLFISTISLVGCFIILCTINIPLTLIIFAFIPLMIWFSVYIRKEMNAAFLRTRQEMAEINANLENSISGIRVSRSYVSGSHEAEKFKGYNDRFQKARGESYRVMAKFFSTTGFFTDFMYLVVLVAGGLFFFYGKINVGDFTAYLLYVNMFLNPVRKLINIFEQLQNGMTGFQRFEELMSQQEEQESPDAKELKDVKGSIDFDHVSFQYETTKDEDARHMVIRDLSMHIDPGKTVALVGPSGGGKTTLCHLIPRFYEVTEGKISIDGQDITTLTRDSLRQNIGMVAQDVFLFTGTIKENIAYGNLDASDEEIMEAAKKANIHDYIMTLPDGYDTYVGERGVKLSGGQKQRISIARVFLKDPSILILDEATSALDNATEMLIQQSLEELAKGRTSIIVAHRLSTIKNADEIIVITDEGIKERGSHEELLALNGIYAGLYQYQFRQ